jgi:hypothetical protein
VGRPVKNGFDKLAESGVSEWVRDRRGYVLWSKGSGSAAVEAGTAGMLTVFKADPRLEGSKYTAKPEPKKLTPDERAELRLRLRDQAAAEHQRVKVATARRRANLKQHGRDWDPEGYEAGVEAEALAKQPPRGERKEYRSWVEHYTGMASGLVMPKRSVFGRDTAEYIRFNGDPLAQLRPDKAVPTRGSFQHDHAKLKWPMSKRKARQHEAKYHRHPETGKLVVPLRGHHKHPATAKYLLPPGESAKRLDCLPLLDDGVTLDAAVYFGSAKVFWFVLEGCIKNDALVTWAAERPELGWRVFNTPSVTTWAGATEMNRQSREEGELVLQHELTAFVQTYVNRDDPQPFIIVADSDWSRNINVRTQADKVTSLLLRLVPNMPVLPVAPPEGDFSWTQPDGTVILHKVGLDDHLAGYTHPVTGDRVAAGSPYQLEAWKVSPTPDYIALMTVQPERLLALADYLLRNLNRNGHVPVSPAAVADILGVSRRTIYNHRDKLLDVGLLIQWIDGLYMTSNARAAGTAVVNPIMFDLIHMTVEDWLSSL